jgi:hypothetical protein
MPKTPPPGKGVPTNASTSNDTGTVVVVAFSNRVTSEAESHPATATANTTPTIQFFTIRPLLVRIRIPDIDELARSGLAVCPIEELPVIPNVSDQRIVDVAPRPNLFTIRSQNQKIRFPLLLHTQRHLFCRPAHR